jgi:hypothetical protein
MPPEFGEAAVAVARLWWRKLRRKQAPHRLRKPHAGRQRDILRAQLYARHVTLSDPETRRDFGLAQAGAPARLAQTPPEFDY